MEGYDKKLGELQEKYSKKGGKKGKIANSIKKKRDNFNKIQRK